MYADTVLNIEDVAIGDLYVAGVGVLYTVEAVATHMINGHKVARLTLLRDGKRRDLSLPYGDSVTVLPYGGPLF